MYYQCIHQRLYHLTPAEYEDFTAIILHARKASYTINLCDKLYSFPCRHLCGQLQDRMSFRTFCLLWEEPSLARRTFGQRSQLLCRMPACPGWAHSSSDIRSESAPPSSNSWPVVQLSFKSDVTAAINSWCSSCFTFHQVAVQFLSLPQVALAAWPDVSVSLALFGQVSCHSGRNFTFRFLVLSATVSQYCPCWFWFVCYL